MRVAASKSEIKGDDSMVVAGSIQPNFVSGQEGGLRATALVVEHGEKLCVVSCDVLMFRRDLIDDICAKVEAQCGIPSENTLIAATHTHHAPSTATVHGYERDETFCERMKEAILLSVLEADRKLKDSPGADLCFWLGSESSVGQNSRLLMKDGTIHWVGPTDDAVRTTGPFDPDLPVLAFRGQGGKLEAIAFNHSTHNIGRRRDGVRSPGFYGLAAQELERELDATVLFLPGASGSTHNLRLTADEMVLRMKSAVKEALFKAQRRDVSAVKSLKTEFEYQVREFDEEKEEEAVSYYCKKRLKVPQPTIEAFRKMRGELSGHQGETRRTWLQAMLIGDIALVGIPGELFTSLGIQIKRRSPYRYTFVVELANDYIGYIPDEVGFDLGGYQVWTGLHSFVARGTGEAIVDEVIRMLSSLTPLG